MRLEQSKGHSIQKYLDTSSKYGFLVQFEARSKERIAILPNTVTCSRSLRHTARRLPWESDTHENEGGALPKSALNSKIATCCTQTEFKNRSTRSTRAGCKNILWPTKRIAELRWNLQQHWLQNSRHTPFCSLTAGQNSQRRSQKNDSAVREPPE